MSSPAPARFQSPTRGWAQIPNSVIENQAAFTHAELALTLIVLRRGGLQSSVTVSDHNWERWTGLKSRMKEHAIRGLKAKGVEVQGRGDLAKFRFQEPHWNEYLRTAERAKPHTAGRKLGVPAAPGAKVHPECRGRGCALLEHENGAPGQNGLSLVPATPIAQPVAQTGETIAAPADPVRRGVATQKLVSVLPATPIAQPVAQTAETAWRATLEMIRSIFPAVGVAFLVRLIATVAAVFADVTDSELAQAVQAAWVASKRRQHSEGLFLFTVPEALAELRRQPKPRAAPNVREHGVEHLRQCAAALQARGAPFAAIAGDLAAVADDFERFKNPGQADREIERINERIYQAGAEMLTPADREDLQWVSGHMDGVSSPEELEQFRRSQILHILALPVVELF